MTDGLYHKFRVERLTESSRGIDHTDCEYFVLDPRHDEFAFKALDVYANLCRKSNPELSFDIIMMLTRATL